MIRSSTGTPNITNSATQATARCQGLLALSWEKKAISAPSGVFLSSPIRAASGLP